MACFLKAPRGSQKGCVVFTTPERDNVIKTSALARSAVEGLRERYLIGLHHNWHDYAFQYDPLFDFSMAGDGDLIEASQRPFARIPLDACNFAPDGFLELRSERPFWDFIYVARAVAFKGIAEFFAAVRMMFDAGHRLRVLFICSTPEHTELPGIENLREHFERMFNVQERKLFSLLTLDWDYPFPFDLETLAFFYRHSKVFVHPAPEERRCRTAAYAWANGMPVVANDHVASILPREFHRPPFLFSYENPYDLAATMVKAVKYADYADSDWAKVIAEFSGRESAARVDIELAAIARNAGRGALSQEAISSTGLDIRLGRHHRLAVGGNRLDYSIESLCKILKDAPDDFLVACLAQPDPEVALARYLNESAKAPADPGCEAGVPGNDEGKVSGAAAATARDSTKAPVVKTSGLFGVAAVRRWLNTLEKD